jgi:hypothetical protein
MCITIPSSANVEHSRRYPAWQWLSATPLRLLAFGGVISLIVWVAFALFSKSPDWVWLVMDLGFGIVPMFIFGIMLNTLPVWLKVTPLRYVRYGMLFFLMLASQMFFYGTLLMGWEPGIFYAVLLLLIWLMMLNHIHQFLKTTYLKSVLIERGLQISLLWGLMVGSALMVSQLISSGATSVLFSGLGLLSYLLPILVLVGVRYLIATQRIH